VPYEMTVWSNGEAPALNADNLNKIEQGVSDAHNLVGIPGANGANGLSAYEVAQSNGFNGTEAQWLDSLVGPPGPPGLAGANGVDGANGAPGNPGAPGANGVDGANGQDGANGTNGTNGLDGRTVLNGAGVPSSSNGSTGDFWIDTAAASIYGPKADNNWGNAVSLIGPKGDTGNNGAQGPAGENGVPGANGQNGAPGANGQNGAPGANGANGVGIPAAGNTGQYLTKSDNNDYNTQWSTLPAIPTLNVFTCKQNAAVSAMNNNATLNNISGMAFNVTNGRSYYFKFTVNFTSTVSTCGVGFCIAGPTMTASQHRVEIQQGGAGTDMFYTNIAFNNLATKLTSASVAANNTTGIAFIEGHCNPSNNGAIQLQSFPEVNNSVTINNLGMGFMVDAG
jgi:hypothetical protein